MSDPEKEMLKELLQESFSIIEFYAKRENWGISYSTEKEIVFREILLDGYGYPCGFYKKSCYYGGSRARKFLKQYGLLTDQWESDENTKDARISREGRILN
jgi:hypothetical protein